MKKTIVITLTVALLGLVGFNAKNKNEKSNLIGSSSNTATSQVTPSSNASSSTSTMQSYKDGTYTGNTAETPYGNVKVAVVIKDGRINDVQFLTMPNDRGHTQEVTQESEPLLKRGALDKQSANIDFVSGATSTSYGYQESLQSALDRAAGASAINQAASSVTV
jgi:uncharacterized protein with FMN-binding domain